MEDKTVIKTLAAVACVFILVVGGCTVRKNELKYEAIKSGVDPMVLSCAVSVGNNEQHICTILAQRGQSK